MDTQQRYETAEKITEIINTGKVWCPDVKKDNAPVRVYLGKSGYLAITADGINIDAVKRGVFQTIDDALTGAGYKTYRA